jgi:hypothetical protein
LAPAPGGADAPAPQAAGAPTPGQLAISLIPPSRVGANSDFAVPVNVAAPAEVQTLSFDLVYDPEQLGVVGVAEGAFMKQGGVGTEFQASPSGSGRYHVSISRPTGGARGGGNVVQVTLHSLAGGTDTTLAIENVSAADPGGAPIPSVTPPSSAVTIVAQ